MTTGQQDTEPGHRFKAAVAVSVAAGSFADPAAIQGLAHAVEHAVFLGSVPWPEENELEAFLSAHGGYSNASTDAEHTTYEMEVMANELPGALQRFLAMLAAPLLRPEAFQREMSAIQSEFEQAALDDDVRLGQIHAEATSPKSHPFALFGWGNAASLQDAPASAGIDVPSVAAKWCAEHYRADCMHVVVRAAAPMADIMALVLPLVATLPPRHHPEHPCRTLGPEALAIFTQERPWLAGMPPACTAPVPCKPRAEPPALPSHAAAGSPWPASQLPAVSLIAPVKSTIMLQVTWAVPSSALALARSPRLAETKPDEWLAHVLGHEVRGSLLAVLKDAGLADSLTAGAGADGSERNSAFTYFSVEVRLSEHGAAQWVQVLQALRVYMDMVRAAVAQLPGGPLAWVQSELATQAALRWAWAEEEDSATQVARLATGMAQGVLDIQAIAQNTLMASQADTAAIQALLEVCSLQRMRVDLMHPALRSFAPPDKPCPFPGLGLSVLDRVEPWFGTRFASQPVPPAVLAALSSACPALGGICHHLRLPGPNAFAPKSPRTQPLVAPEQAVAGARGEPVLSAAPCPPADVNPTAPTATPRLLAAWPASAPHEPELRLWYAQDVVWQQPKTHALLHIACPAVHQTALGGVVARMFVRLIRLALMDVLYQAYLADMDIEVHMETTGIELHFRGFNDQLPRLLHHVLRGMMSFTPSAQAFNTVKEGLARTFKNTGLKPLAMARLARLSVLTVPGPTELYWADELAALDQAAFMGAIGSTASPRQPGWLWSGATMDLLVMGNETPRSALVLGGLVAVNRPLGMASGTWPGKLPVLRAIQAAQHARSAGMDYYDHQALLLATSAGGYVDGSMEGDEAAVAACSAATLQAATAASVLPVPELLRITRGEGQALDSSCPRSIWCVQPGRRAVFCVPARRARERNSVLEVYWQCEPLSAHGRVTVALIDAIMSEPAFDLLRTKRQLGYVVSTCPRLTHNMSGLTLTVQSATMRAAQLSDHVAGFLATFRDILAKLTAEEFAQYVTSVAASKLEPDPSLHDAVNRLWGELSTDRYQWHAHAEDAQAVQKVTHAQLCALFDQLCAPRLASQLEVWVDPYDAELHGEPWPGHAARSAELADEETGDGNEEDDEENGEDDEEDDLDDGSGSDQASDEEDEEDEEEGSDDDAEATGAASHARHDHGRGAEHGDSQPSAAPADAEDSAMAWQHAWPAHLAERQHDDLILHGWNDLAQLEHEPHTVVVLERCRDEMEESMLDTPGL